MQSRFGIEVLARETSAACAEKSSFSSPNGSNNSAVFTSGQNLGLTD
jgi:hypothetical protein